MQFGRQVVTFRKMLLPECRRVNRTGKDSAWYPEGRNWIEPKWKSATLNRVVLPTENARLWSLYHFLQVTGDILSATLVRVY